MSKLTDDCMAGVELRDAALDAYLAVDFAVSNDATSLIFLVNWWNTASILEDGSAQGYPGPLVPGTAGSDPWVVQGAPVSLGPSDSLGAALAENRDEADFDRPKYLSALLDMSAQFPQYDFGPWIAAFQARPQLDAVAETIRRLKAPRQMAKLFMSDLSGNAVDVLVVDERGDAVTASGDSWLSRAAMDFVAHKPDVPDLAMYVNALSTQQPYGGNGLFGPAVFTSGGLLPDVANNLLSDRRIGV